MNVRDVMTSPAASVPLGASIEQALGLMLERPVGGLPVLGADGAVVGILTEGDLLARVELGTTRPKPGWVQYLADPGGLAETYAREHGRRVADVMSRMVVTVAPETGIDEAAALMTRLRIRSLPVVEAGHLIGIVTRTDLLRALDTALQRAAAAPPRDAAAIGTDIEKVFAEAGVIPTERIAVSVEDGAVTLRGLLSDERVCRAACAAAASVPGVRAVHDRLTRIDMGIDRGGIEMGAGQEPFDRAGHGVGRAA